MKLEVTIYDNVLPLPIIHTEAQTNGMSGIKMAQNNEESKKEEEEEKKRKMKKTKERKSFCNF